MVPANTDAELAESNPTTVLVVDDADVDRVVAGAIVEQIPGWRAVYGPILPTLPTWAAWAGAACC
jgi:hypothetical protein